MTAFRLLKTPPPPHLAGVVDSISVYRETGPAGIETFEAASLTIPLVIGFADPFAIGLGRTPGAGDGFVSFTAGLTQRPAEISSTGGAYCLQINFTPLGARAFFGLPLTNLTDAMIDPAAILGAAFRALRERLGDERSWPARIALAAGFVDRRLASAAPLCREAAWAYHAVLGGGGAISVKALAADMGRSRKHVATLLGDVCGLPPRALASIIRFERARALAADGLSLGLVAADAGYADQAHMSRAFKRLSGRSPRRLAEIDRAATQA